MSYATEMDFREKITALFQPDVLVSLQYFEAIKTGPRRLQMEPKMYPANYGKES